MSARGRGRSRSQRGGEGMAAGRENGKDLPAIPPMIEPPKQTGGASEPLNPAPYGAGPGGFAKSQYYTISGGSKRRRSRKNGSKRKHRKHKGGNSVLATAAVPFGLLALQRYFKGSRKSKRGVAKIGRSFKRTFRRRY